MLPLHVGQILLGNHKWARYRWSKKCEGGLTKDRLFSGSKRAPPRAAKPPVVVGKPADKNHAARSSFGTVSVIPDRGNAGPPTRGRQQPLTRAFSRIQAPPLSKISVKYAKISVKFP